MRILALCTEGYPVTSSSGFVLMHQSMALEEMGHEVHLYNAHKPSLRLADHLQAYEFDLIFGDIESLKAEDLRQTLQGYRRSEAVRLVAGLYTLPPPPEEVWDLVDFAVTPWKGRSIDSLARKWDIRYLPLGYNARLHRRQTDVSPLGPVFVGNTTGGKWFEAEKYLKPLRAERILLCIGPGYDQKYLDPFLLGRVYAAARCAPNFHCYMPDIPDRMLNERFWQAARCGIPVNDFASLMADYWGESLLKAFCFADIEAWQERVRALQAGTGLVEPDLLAQLDRSLEGHSYHDRMRQLLVWLE